MHIVLISYSWASTGIYQRPPPRISQISVLSDVCQFPGSSLSRAALLPWPAVVFSSAFWAVSWRMLSLDSRSLGQWLLTLLLLRKHPQHVTSPIQFQHSISCALLTIGDLFSWVHSSNYYTLNFVVSPFWFCLWCLLAWHNICYIHTTVFSLAEQITVFRNSVNNPAVCCYQRCEMLASKVICLWLSAVEVANWCSVDKSVSVCEHSDMHSEERDYYLCNKPGRQTLDSSINIFSGCSPLPRLTPSPFIPGMAVMVIIAEQRASQACGNT